MARAISSDDASYLKAVFATKERHKPYCREESPLGPANWVADASERDINFAITAVPYDIIDAKARIFTTPTGTYWLGRPVAHVGNDMGLTGIWRITNGQRLGAQSQPATQDQATPPKLALAA